MASMSIGSEEVKPSNGPCMRLNLRLMRSHLLLNTWPKGSLSKLFLHFLHADMHILHKDMYMYNIHIYIYIYIFIYLYFIYSYIHEHILAKSILTYQKTTARALR